jgi:Fatty acid desaturase
MLAYAMVQERATALNYRNLRRRARERGGDPALEKLLMLVAVDEQAHHRFFLECVQLYLKHDPQGTLEQLRRVMNAFTMPALHLLADGRQRAARIKGLGIFDEDLYYREVYLARNGCFSGPSKCMIALVDEKPRSTGWPGTKTGSHTTPNAGKTSSSGTRERFSGPDISGDATFSGFFMHRSLEDIREALKQPFRARSGSPGRLPSRGPPRSGHGDFHHPAPPWPRLAARTPLPPGVPWTCPLRSRPGACFPPEVRNHTGCLCSIGSEVGTSLPDVNARMQPSDSPAASAEAPVPLAAGLPRCERFF